MGRKKEKERGSREGGRRGEMKKEEGGRRRKEGEEGRGRRRKEEGGRRGDLTRNSKDPFRRVPSKIIYGLGKDIEGLGYGHGGGRPFRFFLRVHDLHEVPAKHGRGEWKFVDHESFPGLRAIPVLDDRASREDGEVLLNCIRGGRWREERGREKK
jgi:hypothetical protein